VFCVLCELITLHFFFALARFDGDFDWLTPCDA